METDSVNQCKLIFNVPEAGAKKNSLYLDWVIYYIVFFIAA